MHRVLFSVVAAFLVTTSAQATLVWEKKQLNLPAAMGQLELMGSYPFTNTGNSPVQILEVSTNCGCTYAAVSQQVVAPGESAEIVAFFDTAKREGPQRSSLIVRTDDPAAPSITLIFETDIPRLLTLPSRIVRWDADEALTPKHLSLDVKDGVVVSLLKPSKPLPVKAELKQNGETGLQLVLSPYEGALTKRGLLTLEATWGDSVRRIYQIYVRLP
ncbi:MAG: DUF1573 domain-containing protein [Verrucomicrobiota bacterium]